METPKNTLPEKLEGYDTVVLKLFIWESYYKISKKNIESLHENIKGILSGICTMIPSIQEKIVGGR